MMRALVISAAVLLTLSGCASRPAQAPWRFGPPGPARSEPITALNQDMNAEVGGVVYTHGERRFVNADLIRFSESAVAQLEVGHAIRVKAGDGWRLMVVTPGGQRAVCLDTVKSGAVAAIPGWTPSSGCLIDEDGDGAFEVATFKLYSRKFPVAKPIAYTVETYPPESSIDYGGVRREVVYSGTTNGNIRLTYREFSLEGMARTAFTEDISYSLDARGQAEVGMKGMRLQVISATNSRLTYRVLRSMD